MFFVCRNLWLGSCIFLCNRIRVSKGLHLNLYEQIAQKKYSKFHCAKHFAKPLKAWSVFSRGFHASWVLSPLHNEKLSIFLLCNLTIKVMEQTVWHPNRNRKFLGISYLTLRVRYKNILWIRKKSSLTIQQKSDIIY